MRCFEQIRNDVCFHDLDVTLLGIGSGLSYGILSNTHFALEDIAILRTLPNMTIFSPADEMEGRLGMKSLKDYNHPVYVRIGLRTEPVVYPRPFNFILGKGNVLKEGKDIVIFVTGNLIEETLKAAKILENKIKVHATVIDIHTIKPIDKKIILRNVKNKKTVFTVEEHGVIGGLGDAVLSVIGENPVNVRVIKIGMADQYVKVVGNRDYLRKVFGLDSLGIAGKIEKSLNNL